LKFNLFDDFAAVVGDVDVDVDAGTADPDLAMEAGCETNDFDGGSVRLDPLV